jgi:hypothetical protein
MPPLSLGLAMRVNQGPKANRVEVRQILTINEVGFGVDDRFGRCLCVPIVEFADQADLRRVLVDLDQELTYCLRHRVPPPDARAARALSVDRVTLPDPRKFTLVAVREDLTATVAS